MNAPVSLPASPVVVTDAPVAMADIQDVVCIYFEVSGLDLRSARRTAAIVWPRQVAHYLCVALTDGSLPAIGRWWGKDHTTVLHSLRKVEALIESDASVRETIEALKLAARALAGQRRAAPPPEMPIDIARRVVAACGGSTGKAGDVAVARAATRVSAIMIVEICEELIALESELSAIRSERDALVRWRAKAAEVVAPPPKASVLLDTPMLLPATLASIMHDFLGAEAMTRRKPFAVLRNERDRQAERLRDYALVKKPPRPVVDVVEALDAYKRAEFSTDERHAEARYRAAVDALAKLYSNLVATEAEDGEGKN